MTHIPPTLPQPVQRVFNPMPVLVPWLMGLLWVALFLNMLSTASFAYMAWRYPGLIGVPVPQMSPEQLTVAGMNGCVMLLAGGVMIAELVLWLIWVYRIAANLRVLGVLGLRYSPGWCVGWSLIPIVNLVMIYLVMRELTRASDPNNGPTAWRQAAAPMLLNSWWACALIGIVVGMIGNVMSDPQFGTPVPEAAIPIAGAGVFNIIGILLLIRLIGRVQRDQLACLSGVSDAPEPWQV